MSDLAARYVSKFGAKKVAKGMEKMGVNPAKIKKLTEVDLSGSKASSKTKNQYKNTSKTGKVSAGAWDMTGGGGVINAKGLFADYVFNGNSYRVAYGTNGFIVSFYPID